jgi:hypothetical protein
VTGAGVFPLDERLNGTLDRSGFVSDSGDLALLAARDNLPALQVLTRPATGLDDLDLLGTYHFVSFTPAAGGVSTWGRLAFDGQGAATVPAPPLENDGGVVTTEPNLLAATYALAETGDIDVALTFQGSRGPFPRAFAGCAGSGGDLIVASRVDDTGGAQASVFAAVRAATNADLDTFFGRYAVGILFAATDDPMTSSFATLLGTLIADGEGNVTLDGELHITSGFQDIESLEGSYTVAADGTLSITLPELNLQGGIDGAGRLAVLGGDTVSLLPAAFAIVVRAAVDPRN